MTGAATTQNSEYRVLARKYRPRTFAELIGQEAMVKTLKNAIDTGRIAHAFIMTGVRGVGKTSTARLIARGLNCTGPDGGGGPTVSPCGLCETCKAIAESRHVDVIEMDAASRTGVDDIREIIDGVQYAPASARFKIYIIDEVHMLSKNAFNALLKTLEEPPPHVKFIFATTEVRKLPVTVLSRCQRFDLRRVSAERLTGHFGAVCEKEGVTAEEKALGLIARASEGSVRDGLSLLDQAIAHGGGHVTESMVRDMLGLADRARTLELFEALMKGDAPSALAALRDQYDLGADPVAILQDLLDVAHWLTRLKVVPDAGADILVSEAGRDLGGRMASGLGMAHLTRAWQMLLKGIREVSEAANTIAAAEMVLIRICFAADLPNPADLARSLKDAGRDAGQDVVKNSGNSSASDRPSSRSASRSGPVVQMRTAQILALNPSGAEKPAARYAPPPDFERFAGMFDNEKEGVLATHLRDNCHLVFYAPGRLELRIAPSVPRDFPGRVRTCAEAWTGIAWGLTIATAGGEKSLREKEADQSTALKAEAMKDPAVAAILDAFPGAEIASVADLAAAAAAETAFDAMRAGGDLEEFVMTSNIHEDADSDPLSADFQ